MPHSFASKVALLKALKAKLSISTYEAVFSRTIEGWQQATADAVALRKELENELDSVFSEAQQVTDFARSPSRGLADTIDQFIHLVENPFNGAMSASEPIHSCTGMPSRHL